MKLLRLPGLIDIHTHMRDPGETYKEDFLSGTSAALAGGITTIFDMPNNLAPVFSEKVLNQKKEIAKSKAVCDFGLYFGTDGHNIDEFEAIASKVVGLKLYLNMTTGQYLVTDEDLIERIFKAWPKQKVLTVHAKGNKVDLALDLGRKYSNKLHLAHVSNREMLEKVIEAKKDKLNVTCEVAPHHLFLTEGNSRSILEDSLFTVQPPLATQKDRDFLWANLKWIDCIATDHAPHLISEKKSADQYSGFPGLETLLPLMLTAVSENRLSVKDLVRLTSVNAAIIFNLKMDESTFVSIDTEEQYQIENINLLTKCAWSPFTGIKVKGRVKKVYLRGIKVFENGKVLTAPGSGRLVT